MNKFMAGMLLIFFCCLVTANDESKSDIFEWGDYYFHTVGDRDEIQDGAVAAIVQDLSGHLWFGTQLGLVRYDGYNYKQYRFDKNDPDSIS